MAEVPEVETIVQDLRGAVVGRTVEHVDVMLIDAVRFPDPQSFCDMLPGHTIAAAERRAKHILLPLDGDLLLEMHFMLWGTLRLIEPSAPRPPETMIVYLLDNGQELRLLDKLGYARAAAGTTAAVAERLDLASLGPDALDPGFTLDVFTARLAKRRGALKTVLLNQRVFAGLGNRDADESMWLAGIDPRRSPVSLAGEELARLHDAIGHVLREGLEQRGTQADLFGVPGRAKHRRNVFERTGQPCPRCGAPIQHLRLGNRNTHFCTTCQK